MNNGARVFSPLVPRLTGVVAVIGAALVAAGGGVASAHAAEAPAGARATEEMISWVTVGDPGNPPDTQVMNDGTTGYGSVDYSYRLGKYHVTNAQYAAFLNAKAKTDPVLLYDPCMDRSMCFGLGSGIIRSGTPGSFTYAAVSGRANRPVNYVSVFDAMRMANWLQNGQGEGDTETGAYTLLGGTPVPANDFTVVRNPEAMVFLPTENEWYKAAYYNRRAETYFFSPMRTNVPIKCGAPGRTPNTANCEGAAGNEGTGGGALTDVGSYTGSAGPYGTFDQGGNVFEYTETLTSLAPTCIIRCLPAPPGFQGPYRILRGTSYVDGAEWGQATGRGSIYSETEFAAQGFRLASAVPTRLTRNPAKTAADTDDDTTVRTLHDTTAGTFAKSPSPTLAATGQGWLLAVGAVSCVLLGVVLRRWRTVQR